MLKCDKIDEWPKPFVRPRSREESRLEKWWFLLAILCAPVRGMEREKLLWLHLRERGAFSGLTLFTSCAPVGVGKGLVGPRIRIEPK